MTGSELNYTYHFGPFRLVMEERVLWRENRLVPLAPRAFDMLLMLVQNRGRILGKDDLMKRLWPDTVVGENNLVQIVSALRRALGQPPHEHGFIETDPGRGYRFVARVQEWQQEESEATAAKPRSAQPLKYSSLASIAVLPFTCLCCDAQREYLQVGMADALITKLSAMNRIVVRPTSAVRRYSGSTQDTLAIGRELRVDAILEGTLQDFEGRVRVTARLVKVEDGSALWVAKFNSPFAGIFELQDEISEQAARALIPTLSGEDQQRLAERPTGSIEAHEQYVRGRYFLGKRREESIPKAIECFRKAIDIDPAYAQAYDGLADAYNLAGMLDFSPPHEVFPKAKAAACRALTLNENLAEAHASLGASAFYYDWDFHAAEREFQRALELNPNYATAHHWYGWILAAWGRREESRDALTRAHELDPLSLVISATLGGALNNSRLYDDAIEELHQGLELDPSFPISLYSLAIAYAQKQLYSQAIEAARRAVECSNGMALTLGTLGTVYAMSGHRDEARDVIAEFQLRSTQRYIPSYFVALIHALLGEVETALVWFDRAYEERSHHLLFLNVHPAVDCLRNNESFQDLVRRVGLPART